MEANSILVSAFPQSAIKFVVTADPDYTAIDNLMCFASDFKEQFMNLYEQYGSIKEIYVIGPNDYVSKFIGIMEKIVDPLVNIIKEG